MSSVPPFTSLPYDVPNISTSQPISLSPVENAMAETQNGVSPSSKMLRFPSESIQFGTLFRFVKYDYQSQKTNINFTSITYSITDAIGIELCRCRYWYSRIRGEGWRTICGGLEESS